MSTLNDLIGALQWISGILCAVIILVSIIQIIMNSSEDSTRYTNRIRNALIALILILLIIQITNLVANYFPESSTTTALGDFSDISIEGSSDTTALLAEEKYPNEDRYVIVSFGESEYAITDINSVTVNYGKSTFLWDKAEYKVECFTMYTCSEKSNGKAKLGKKTYYLTEHNQILSMSDKGNIYDSSEEGNFAYGTGDDLEWIGGKNAIYVNNGNDNYSLFKSW